MRLIFQGMFLLLGIMSLLYSTVYCVASLVLIFYDPYSIFWKVIGSSIIAFLLFILFGVFSRLVSSDE